MESIAFACIAPHGWLMIPLVAGPDGSKTSASREALEEMGRRMEAARPETVVVLEPHGLMIDNAISLIDSPKVAGRTYGPVALGALPHGYAMEFEADRELNAAITAAAREEGAPVARARNNMDFLPLSIDFGTMNPLWYLGATILPQPRLVAACTGPGVPREAYVGFGRAVRRAARQLGRRIAFVASMDMAHTHTHDGLLGFDPAAAECDAAVVGAVRDHDLGRVLGYDDEWLRRAVTDAVEPLLALHGLLEGTDLRPEVLSYEVPTYLGMLCATYS